MSIDPKELPADHERGYDLAEHDGVLRVTLKKNFDTCRAIDRWAFKLVRAVSGPFRRVEVDLAPFLVISSTVIAGLVHLSDAFGKTGTRVHLVNVGTRVRHILEMTHLAPLFVLPEAPPPANG